MRTMRRGPGCGRRGVYLLVRMHVLSGLRSEADLQLSELWRGVSPAAQALPVCASELTCSLRGRETTGRHIPLRLDAIGQEAFISDYPHVAKSATGRARQELKIHARECRCSFPAKEKWRDGEIQLID
jgi:hypothetical protein